MIHTGKKQVFTKGPWYASAPSVFGCTPLPLIFLLLFIAGCQAGISPVPTKNNEMPASDGRTLGTNPHMTAIPADTIPADSLIVTIPAVKQDPLPGPCARLDDPLRQLSEADDPQLFAQQHGLWLTVNGVGVKVQLTSPETFLDLTAYQIALRNQRAAIVEAFVPVQQLCNLAMDEAILRISPLRPLQRP